MKLSMHSNITLLIVNICSINFKTSVCHINHQIHLGTINVNIYQDVREAYARRTRGVRVVFSVTRMRSSNSARMNKFDFTTEKIGSSVHMTVFEIVAHCNVDNWIQLLT